MRTTLDIPDNLINEAMEASGAKTKTMAVCLALQEYIRRKKTLKIMDYRGKLDLDMDMAALRDNRVEWGDR